MLRVGIKDGSKLMDGLKLSIEEEGKAMLVRRLQVRKLRVRKSDVGEDVRRALKIRHRVN